MVEQVSMAQLNSALAQVQREISSAFSTMISLQALTAAVEYQQLAEANGYDSAWVSLRIAELAATIDREASKCEHQELADGYLKRLRQLAAATSAAGTARPMLQVIDGGKDSDPSAD